MHGLVSRTLLISHVSFITKKHASQSVSYALSPWRRIARRNYSPLPVTPTKKPYYVTTPIFYVNAGKIFRFFNVAPLNMHSSPHRSSLFTRPSRRLETMAAAQREASNSLYWDRWAWHESSSSQTSLQKCQSLTTPTDSESCQERWSGCTCILRWECQAVRRKLKHTTETLSVTEHSGPGGEDQCV